MYLSVDLDKEAAAAGGAFCLLGGGDHTPVRSKRGVYSARAEESSWTLPLGSVLHPAEGTWIPVTTAGSSAIQTMVYGDPMNYELGLFGDYTVRVDESVKAVERMLTILGDAMVGGNLIVDKGFVVATVAATG